MHMRIVKAVLTVFTLAALSGAAYAQDATRSCPKTLTLNGGNHALDSVTVYNGSPADDAILLLREFGMRSSQ